MIASKDIISFGMITKGNGGFRGRGSALELILAKEYAVSNPRSFVLEACAFNYDAAKELIGMMERPDELYTGLNVWWIQTGRKSRRLDADLHIGIYRITSEGSK